MAAKRSAAEGASVRLFHLCLCHLPIELHLSLVSVLRSAAALPAHEAARGAEYTKLARAALAGTACFDPHLFISPSIDDKLMCTLCPHVIRKARMVTENGDAHGKLDPCNCVVGGGCLSKSLAVRQVCPSCSRPFVPSDVFAERDREVASLKVKCHVAPDACAATGELGRGDRLWWRAHEAVCGFVDMACPHCAAQMPRRDLDRHVQNNCLVLNMVAGCCEVLLVALRSHPSTDSPAFRVTLMTFLGLADVPAPSVCRYTAIVQLMIVYKSVRLVQEVACIVLAKLCSDPGSGSLAGAVGACEAVVTSLVTHGADRHVAAYACRALDNLVSNHPANQERAGVAGACPALLTALTSHGADPEVAMRVSWALQSLVCLPANQHRAADAGVIECLIATMARFPAHAGIQGHACSVLNSLSQLPAHLPHMVEAGARAALAAALHAHPGDANIRHWGAAALARLPQ